MKESEYYPRMKLLVIQKDVFLITVILRIGKQGELVVIRRLSTELNITFTVFIWVSSMIKMSHTIKSLGN